MKIKINSPLLWKILTIICISILIVFASGCKSGKKLNTNSSGIHRVITPSELIRQPNGTYKIRPLNLKMPESRPIRTAPPKITKAAKSKPKLIGKSVKAKSTEETVKGVGETKSFTPSISTAPVKLPPAENKLPLPVINNTPTKIRVNVVKNDKADGKNASTISEKGPKIAGTGETGPKKSSGGITIKYVELILFYLLGFLVMAFAYIIYDIYKNKKEKNLQAKKTRKKRGKKVVKSKSS